MKSIGRFFCENDLKLSLFPSPYMIEIHLIVLETPVRHIMFNRPLKIIDYYPLLFKYNYWQESALHITQGEIFSCFSCFFFLNSPLSRDNHLHWYICCSKKVTGSFYGPEGPLCPFYFCSLSTNN